MTKVIREPVILPLGYQGEHFAIRVTWPVERVFDPPEPDMTVSTPEGFHGLTLLMRPDDLPEYPSAAIALYLDVGRAWKDHCRTTTPDTRECPGCKKLLEYDTDTWSNIAEGKGVLYACELCSLKVEIGRMERIKT